MGDWANTVADIHQATGYFLPTPGASGNTKGAWNGPVSTPGGCGLLIRLSWWQNYTYYRQIALDIGIGVAGSQVVLVSDILFQPSNKGSGSGREHEAEVYLPITVPQGSLWIRAQSDTAGHASGYVQLQVAGGGSPSYGAVCSTYGFNAATTRGTQVSGSSTDGVYGSWTQITASSGRVRSLLIAMTGGSENLNSFIDQWCNLSLGIGAAGSETEILVIAEAGGSDSLSCLQLPQFFGPFNLDIPAGTRVCARLAVQWNSSLQRSRTIALYGVY